MARDRAPKNRTISLDASERERYGSKLLRLKKPIALDRIIDRTIFGDLFEIATFLPAAFVDLLILDPPYNLTKSFGSNSFSKTSFEKYRAWFEESFLLLLPLLKSTASIYVCADWFTSTAIHAVLNQHVHVRNRITWGREKGRGAKANWKNSMEDIWFCTMSDDYFFNLDAVKVRRRVLAPYKENGQPKDWNESENGNFRDTHPSNFWNDITVPFWSMPENTDHPTQKPEKLIAKLVLASSRPDEMVFDPFCGSGTTSVVAKKLGRHFVGIEQEEDFATLAEKRLELANSDRRIQGFSDGVFWERNSAPK
ncbi:MAG TPA: site-specific DNA-methyltransferase [Candidatus Kapabacteria bacterium]|jgi:site-specific DNA-methyltransferase (adenine-specific)